MLERIHFFPGLCLLAVGVGLEVHIVRGLLRRYARRAWIWMGAALASGLLWSGYLLEFNRVARYFPVAWATWLECAAIVELMALIVAAVRLAVPEDRPEFEARRRMFFKTAAAGLCIAPAAVTGFGIVRRNRFRLSEVRILIPNLPRDLDGLRIVQITDIHLSPFLSEQEFARAIDMANETRAHLALVTGDLISRRGDPLDACLRQLARLRAEAGVLGCLGNHEIYTGTSDYVATHGARIGIDFLRSRARLVRFGDASINFAGVDYQRFERPYLRGAQRLIAPGTLNVLLSHNPDVFPVAASQGYDLTIAGHTHGGQVDFEILHQHLNIARAYTPYVAGLYTRGQASAYVSTGLGTIGVPVRIGAPAEVSLLRLCAT
ncbi:MAG TPA: metallophosphoesterase [Bryobacteraceae bacterium]|nr:metallophosphoesterase [Bryobacteraceae bacterium]